MPEILNAEQVAEWLGVDKSTVTRWAKKGQIPGRQVGSLWRFDKAVLQKWMSEVNSAKEAQ